MRKALAVLVLAILMVSAMGPGEGQEDGEGEKEIIVKETRITNDSVNQIEPSISNNNVVWTDYKMGSPMTFSYDINKKTITNLLPTNPYQRSVDIHGNYTVWRDGIDTNENILVYHLTSGDYFYIPTNETLNTIGSPRIYYPIVVWEGAIIINNEILEGIYAYNLTNQTMFNIVMNISNKAKIDIWENWVVWTDNRNGNLDIYGYNLVRNEEIQITNNNFSQSNPSIWKDRIVWVDYRHRIGSDVEERDIYYYNLTTNEERRITNSTTSWGNPVIWGDNIVWARADIDNIYLYNVPSNITYVYNVELATRDISIYENKLALVGNRFGNLDIYLLEFSFPSHSQPPQPSEPSFWEQNRMPIGLGISFVIIAIVLIFILQGKKGQNKEGKSRKGT